MPLLEVQPAMMPELFSLPSAGVPLVLGLTALALVIALLVSGLRYRHRCHKLEEALSESDARFNQAADALLVFSIHDDRPTPFASVSERACQLLGYAQADLQERGLHELITEEGHRALTDHLSALQQKGQALHILPLHSASGETLLLELHSHQYRHGEQAQFITSARPVQGRQFSGGGLPHSPAASPSSRASRQTSPEARRAASESDSPEPPAGNYPSASCDGDADHPSALLCCEPSGDGAPVAVAEPIPPNMRIEIAPQRLDVVAKARSVVRLLRPLARRKRLKLRLISGYEELWAVQDAIAITRILNNLIGNAIRFTESGSITVSMDACADHVSITVQDTGPGIPHEDLPLLFGSSHEAWPPPADGLPGLQDTKRLVTAINGTVTVESEPGSGSTFTATFPRTYVSRASAPAPPSTPPLLSLVQDNPYSTLRADAQRYG